MCAGGGGVFCKPLDIIVFKVDTLPSSTPGIRADFAQATTLAPANSDNGSYYVVSCIFCGLVMSLANRVRQ